MTIRLFKYPRPPRNPSIKPNIFQKKYQVRNYEKDLPGNLRDGIARFIINMNLAFGETFDYDWDRPECHDMRNKDNELVNCLFMDHVMTDLLNCLQEFGEDFQKEFKWNNDRFCFQTYFAEIELEYGGTDIVSRNQISISNRTGVFVSTMSYRFKLG